MNKHILCVMDKSKTAEELKENVASIKVPKGFSTILHLAADSSDVAAYEHWLNEYFKITGESREDYEKEIVK